MRTRVRQYVGAKWQNYSKNFRNNPRRDAVLYLLVLLVWVLMTVVCLLEPWIGHACEWELGEGLKFENPLAGNVICLRRRKRILLGLSAFEASLGRRLLTSMIMGALVGSERRAIDKPAGVRTNACVSIGACCYTVCSMFAFESGTMTYDASRSTAQIPAGVTFLGSAMIFKKLEENRKYDKTVRRSHGLLTAATVWVTAAIGAACGGSLYYAALFCTVIIVCLNRFGKEISAAASSL